MMMMMMIDAMDDDKMMMIDAMDDYKIYVNIQSLSLP